MRRLIAPSAALFVVATFAGCAGSRVTWGGEPKYALTAAENLRIGEEELKSKDYELAAKFFERTKNRFPFSKEAVIAELRIGDAKFGQSLYVEAAAAYASFVKLHPNHEAVDYAQFRIGLSHYKDAPTDFFLFPASYELDLRQIRAAVEELEEFVKARPESKHVAEAKATIAEAKARLADHDWYVAKFYAKRNHWAGAASRLEGLIKDYPGSPRETEAMLELARAYLEMNERHQAQQTLQRLIAKYPNDERRAEAEKLLASIR